ncbi:MAG TPA: hypothetical protein VIJ47_01935, partial [Acidimicrobiales bacterium]
STNGTAAVVDGLTIGTDRDEAPVAGFPAGVRALMADASAHRPDLTTFGGVLGFLGRNTVHHPVAMTEYVAIKSVRAWYSTESGKGDKYLLLMQVPVALGIGFSAVLLWRRRLFRHPAAPLLLVVPAYFWIMTIAVLPLLRQMVPSLGLLLILPAALVAHVTSGRSLAGRPITDGRRNRQSVAGVGRSG